MKKITQPLISFTLLAAMILLPSLAFGASITDQMKTPLTNVSLPAGDETQVLTMVGSAINIFLSILGIIFLILMIYGGFTWMKAMGKEEDVSKAKEVIRAAIIGLVIVMSAYAIAYFVTTRLENL